MIINKISRTTAITIVCILLGFMIAVQFKSINNNRKLSAFQNKREEELKDEIINLQNKNYNLENRLKELKGINEQYENVGNIEEDLKNRLIKTKMFAGTLPVSGSGLFITLSSGTTFNVQGADLLLLINELRAADAQAISINDERIVAMSEIRAVSNSYIMVNSNQIFEPYVIKAIGDPEKMEHSLKMIGGVIEGFISYGFKVGVEKSSSIVTPAVRDDGTVIKTDLLTPVEAE